MCVSFVNDIERYSRTLPSLLSHFHAASVCVSCFFPLHSLPFSLVRNISGRVCECVCIRRDAFRVRLNFHMSCARTLSMQSSAACTQQRIRTNIHWVYFVHCMQLKNPNASEHKNPNSNTIHTATVATRHMRHPTAFHVCIWNARQRHDDGDDNNTQRLYHTRWFHRL